ncbi:hypothetical protein CRI94_12485 [Longibacter salinarum]|uniref:O-antigen polymerase n=1 Tax=Longibacter salinarum TaxID=1850348 RepID=A0A2A8CVZ3_9BACT|nr:hypothetical protein [Longibacter salinarum]PEN12816.1 hypothetical protein CRI94_12485 [Longibacter salinarum]
MSRERWLRLAIVVAMFLGAATITVLIDAGHVRLVVAGTCGLILFGIALKNVRLAILALLIYLTLLGDLRRLLVPISGWSGNDPILLVGPALTLILFIAAVMWRRVSLDSTAAKVIALFMVFMTLQIFNPKQGGLMVGVAGAMLYLVPMLWFWIGQAFTTEQMMRTWFLRIMPALALVAALMGLYQVFYGWLPYQLDWYRIAGYSALGPNEQMLRSISIFPNISEYIQYIGIVVVVASAAAFKKQRGLLLLSIVIFAALFLAGSRGPIAKIIVAISILYTVQGRSIATWAPRLAFTVLIGGMALFWGLSQAGQLASSGSIDHQRVSRVLDRQSDLIPTTPGAGGTVAIHGHLFWIGIKSGFTDPLGKGIGATTLAASKYGDSGGSTEKDLSDMFKGGGLIGGFLYLCILVLVAVKAVRYWQRERSLIGLVFVGMLAFTGLSWLKPGFYVLTPLTWLTIGALDHLDRTSETDNAESR